MTHCGIFCVLGHRLPNFHRSVADPVPIADVCLSGFITRVWVSGCNYTCHVCIILADHQDQVLDFVVADYKLNVILMWNRFFGARVLLMEVISSDFAENECKIFDKKEVSTAADLELYSLHDIIWSFTWLKRYYKELRLRHRGSDYDIENLVQLFRYQ